MREVITTPDVAQAVVDYLTAALAARSEACARDVTVSTKHQNPLPLPYVRVRRVGGQTDLVLDRAVVDGLVWHKTEEDELALGRLVHDLLLAIQNDTVNGVLLYAARDFLAPINVPDPTDSNRRIALTSVQVVARARNTTP